MQRGSLRLFRWFQRKLDRSEFAECGTIIADSVTPDLSQGTRNDELSGFQFVAPVQGLANLIEKIPPLTTVCCTAGGFVDELLSGVESDFQLVQVQRQISGAGADNVVSGSDIGRGQINRFDRVGLSQPCSRQLDDGNNGSHLLFQ